ncbi:hypothetical protein FB451DRAFT_1560729 [Mycena latifolia]|nr:hypothetical protein FB451DRAFT_1560729 [Mycena latifolia]
MPRSTVNAICQTHVVPSMKPTFTPARAPLMTPLARPRAIAISHQRILERSCCFPAARDSLDTAALCSRYTPLIWQALHIEGRATSPSHTVTFADGRSSMRALSMELLHWHPRTFSSGSLQLWDHPPLTSSASPPPPSPLFGLPRRLQAALERFGGRMSRLSSDSSSPASLQRSSIAVPTARPTTSTYAICVRAGSSPDPRASGSSLSNRIYSPRTVRCPDPIVRSPTIPRHVDVSHGSVRPGALLLIQPAAILPILALSMTSSVTHRLRGRAPCSPTCHFPRDRSLVAVALQSRPPLDDSSGALALILITSHILSQTLFFHATLASLATCGLRWPAPLLPQTNDPLPALVIIKAARVAACPIEGLKTRASSALAVPTALVLSPRPVLPAASQQDMSSLTLMAWIPSLPGFMDCERSPSHGDHVLPECACSLGGLRPVHYSNLFPSCDSHSAAQAFFYDLPRS